MTAGQRLPVPDELIGVTAAMSLPRSAQVHGSAEIERGVVIGENVVIESGAKLLAGGGIPTKIENKAHVGKRVIINPGINVGVEAIVRDDSVVCDDVPALAIVSGDPARVISYSHTTMVNVPPADACVGAQVDDRSEHVHVLPEVAQERGRLVVLERGRNLPFEPRRCLFIYGVPSGDHRGDHAHRTLEEMLVCVSGNCDVLLDNGKGHREVVHLDRPSLAVRVPPRVWTAQFNHSPNAVMLVIASAEYYPADYITQYGDFLDLINAS